MKSVVFLLLLLLRNVPWPIAPTRSRRARSSAFGCPSWLTSLGWREETSLYEIKRSKFNLHRNVNTFSSYRQSSCPTVRNLHFFSAARPSPGWSWLRSTLRTPWPRSQDSSRAVGPRQLWQWAKSSLKRFCRLSLTSRVSGKKIRNRI